MELMLQRRPLIDRRFFRFCVKCFLRCAKICFALDYEYFQDTSLNTLLSLEFATVRQFFLLVVTQVRLKQCFTKFLG